MYIPNVHKLELQKVSVVIPPMTTIIVEAPKKEEKNKILLFFNLRKNYIINIISI